MYKGREFKAILHAEFEASMGPGRGPLEDPISSLESLGLPVLQEEKK